MARANTVLISENLQAESWALTDAKKLSTASTFLWWNDPPADTRDYRINQGKTPPPKRRERVYCRPSSNHPGGVVVSFCAGNVRFIAEDIDYNVYKQLMTPNGAASGDTTNKEITENDFLSKGSVIGTTRFRMFGQIHFSHAKAHLGRRVSISASSRCDPLVSRSCLLATCLLAFGSTAGLQAAEDPPVPVDAGTLHGKVMCGYQGWFRCPGDGSNLGWIHWSRDSHRIAPNSLSFDMWPDMSEYAADECFAAPGFSYPDGRAAALFSSANAKTVLRHCQWMRDYGIDGAWLQHFVVDLPGGPSQDRYPSRLVTLNHVAAAAEATGRVWALTYDVAGMPGEKLFQTLTADWKKTVDEKIVSQRRYLHQDGLPVVQVFGFYRRSPDIAMTAEIAEQLIDFFHAPGPYQAYLVGGGDWDWRNNSDPQWQACYRRLDAYVPWNVGNYSTDAAGDRHAATKYWPADRSECERSETFWIPSVYPGFSWDNLKQKPAGTTEIPRRGGRFYWEQFHELARMEVDTVYVAMFDEVDEGTAIFKVTSSPPTQAHFVGYDGLPADWYLRLTGEGARMLRKQRPLSAEDPHQAMMHRRQFTTWSSQPLGKVPGACAWHRLQIGVTMMTNRSQIPRFVR